MAVEIIENFTMISGNTKTLNVKLYTNDGVAVNVSDAGTAIYKMADSNWPDGAVRVTKTNNSGITLSVGTASIALSSSDTESLHGNYYHELYIVDSDGNVYTPLQGNVTIKRNLI